MCVNKASKTMLIIESAWYDANTEKHILHFSFGLFIILLQIFKTFWYQVNDKHANVAKSLNNLSFA